ncbi:MAG TPA: hypothetical protein VNJ47_11600 [Nevskiales bacterium]|nr:hypothetical protein [Nevskiales bacterium]
MSATRRRQQGLTLVVGLIMLIMISLAAVVSYNIARTSLDVVGNMQFRNEAVASANSVIQEALSTTRMFETPDTVFLTGLCAGANSRCFDLNKDGVNDITVVLAPPRCIRATVIPNREFAGELASPDFLVRQEAMGCVTSGAQELLATVGAAAGESLCAASVWDLVATATDAKTGTSVVVTQGAKVRVGKDDLDAGCL